MRNWSNLPRRIRFFVLEKIMLPIAIVPLRMLVWSWRTIGPDETAVREVAATPRAILATYHGMFLQLLAYSRLINEIGKRGFVLVSPSLDGRLLGAMLSYFGLDHLCAAPGNRAVGGSLDFVRRVEAGEIGIVAVDGPRGPVRIARPQILQLAEAAHSEIFLAITSARRGIHFPSWDRCHLPLPFSAVEFRLEHFPFATAGSQRRGVDELQAAMDDTGHAEEALRSTPE